MFTAPDITGNLTGATLDGKIINVNVRNLSVAGKDPRMNDETQEEQKGRSR